MSKNALCRVGIHTLDVLIGYIGVLRLRLSQKTYHSMNIYIISGLTQNYVTKPTHQNIRSLAIDEKECDIPLPVHCR